MNKKEAVRAIEQTAREYIAENGELQPADLQAFMEDVSKIVESIDGIFPNEPLEVVGDGSIFFCRGGEKGGPTNEFILIRGEPGEIGRTDESLCGKQTIDVPTLLRIRFSNPASLRVCWEELGELLKMMEAEAARRNGEGK